MVYHLNHTPPPDMLYLTSPVDPQTANIHTIPQAIFFFLIFHKPIHPISTLSFRRNQPRSPLACYQSTVSPRVGRERRHVHNTTKLRSDCRKGPRGLRTTFSLPALFSPVGAGNLYVRSFAEHSSGEAGPRVVPARRPRPPPVGTQSPLSQALQVYLPLSSPRAAHVLVVTKGC